MQQLKLRPDQLRKAHRRFVAGEAPKTLAHEYGVHYLTMLKYLRQVEKGIR